ncbi:MAG: hypothetical protein ABI559_05655 [Chloroflexota bacterium]
MRRRPFGEKITLRKKVQQMLFGQNIWLVIIVVFIILVILGVITVAA